MKSNANGGLTRVIGKVFFFGCALLAGCAQLINSPPELVDPAELGDGRLVIYIGSYLERTVLPRPDQFSKILLTFKRQGGSETLPPVEAGIGETVIALNQGTWEVTADAYNQAETPEVVASAMNVLTRNGESVTGNTRFVLAPTGSGPGTLRYAIAPPEGIALDPALSRIRIEQAGELVVGGLIPLSGALTGTLNLDPGSYTVDIVLDDAGGPNTAAFHEAALILPGLTTDVAFAPQAGDFLDPDVRAALTNVATVQFRGTKNNSSHTVIGASGGGEIHKTQALSVPNGTATVYFTLTGLQNHAISTGGADGGKVNYVTTGTVDGHLAKKTDPVFTVNTADIAERGGDLEFTLTLGETGKTPVVYTVTLNVARLVALHAITWPKRIYVLGDAFDPAGLDLVARYSDNSTVVHYSVADIETEGFDSSVPGEQSVLIKKYGVAVKQYPGFINPYTSSFFPTENLVNSAATLPDMLVTIMSERRLAFDPDIEAEHLGSEPGVSSIISYVDPVPSGYTVSSGRTLILAPYKWYIPDSAEYEWEIDGVPQASTTEYLSFPYSGTGPNPHTVTVKAKLNGSEVAAASAEVYCVAGATLRQPGSTSQARAAKLFSVVAPGQFGDRSPRLGSWNGAGGFGGYGVYQFDHSVGRKGTDGKEIKVGGNLGPWTEPGAIWVSMDDNGNGIPDDTWYEVKGSEHSAPDTFHRYAVTFRADKTWIDNLGGAGTYPDLQVYTGGEKPEMTFVGTRLDKRTVGLAGVWGYADVADDQKISISNAVQVDGTPANLPFIDFVKIVTAVHHGYDDLGEISTEAGTPRDMSLNDPAMAMEGVSSGGSYVYTFKNDSVFDLIITFEGVEFTLSKKGAATTVTTRTSTSSLVYIDFRGGNVEMEIKATQKDTAHFTNNGSEW
jgi:hypothetical protein